MHGWRLRPLQPQRPTRPGPPSPQRSRCRSGKPKRPSLISKQLPRPTPAPCRPPGRPIGARYEPAPTGPLRLLPPSRRSMLGGPHRPPRRNPNAAPRGTAPAGGASALEQLESEPPEPEPGAAKELFGTVPTGGMLAGDDEDPGPPPDLDSPEEVLRPLAIDHEDPDLPAVDERARPTNKRAQPLAAFKPAGFGALEGSGEHRVAGHTRRGGHPAAAPLG